MRRRRAERCLLRAEVALDAGFEDEARAALDEARRLDWQSPDFESLKARIDQRRAAEAAQRDGRRRLVYLAAAVLAVAVAGAAFLMSDRSRAPIAATAAAPPPAAVPATAPALLVPELPDSAAESAPSPPPTQPASMDIGETLPASSERLRPENSLPDRGDMTAKIAAPEPPVREAVRVRELPPVAVPTTSLAVQQTVPDVAATIGRSSIGSVTPPPMAEARVPDLPPAPPAAPPSSPRAESPPPPDDSGVRAALAQYESAYSSLNAASAHAIYPGVDERSLERAFDSLDSQRVSLGRCSISMNGARAQATCQGSASWTPKVGGGTRSSARAWRFDLASTGGTWKITRAEAR